MLCQPFVVHPLCTQNWVKFLLCILPCSTWISRAQRTLGGRQEASKSNYSRWQVHWLADWSRFSLSNLKLFLFFFGYLFFLLLHLPTADQTQNIDSRTRTLSSSASESSSSLLQSIWPPESKTMFNVEQAERVCQQVKCQKWHLPSCSHTNKLSHWRPTALSIPFTTLWESQCIGPIYCPVKSLWEQKIEEEKVNETHQQFSGHTLGILEDNLSRRRSSSSLNLSLIRLFGQVCFFPHLMNGSWLCKLSLLARELLWEKRRRRRRQQMNSSTKTIRVLVLLLVGYVFLVGSVGKYGKFKYYYY